MKVLSLFDGMACGMLAMQAAGVKVDRYVAYEIDKYAVKTAAHNFPMIEHRGDVFDADFAEYRGFDILVGGSPCTYWSIAQKSCRETEASGMGWELFSQYVRALHEAQPTYFVYENNKSMSAAIRQSITQAFGFEPICINSALVSAQNRQRLYWVGRRNPDGGYSRVDVKQPEERGVRLCDIIEPPAGDTEAVGVGYRNRRESDGRLYRRFETHGQPKANALTTVRTDSMISVPCRSIALRGRDNGAMYEMRDDEKANTVTGGTQHRRIVMAAAAAGTGDVYEVKDGRIAIAGKEYAIKLPDGRYLIRHMTVTECKRLQTVPDWYEFPVSNTQAYKMLGNGWTVDVIAHLLRGCCG